MRCCRSLGGMLLTSANSDLETPKPIKIEQYRLYCIGTWWWLRELEVPGRAIVRLSMKMCEFVDFVERTFLIYVDTVTIVLLRKPEELRRQQ